MTRPTDDELFAAAHETVRANAPDTNGLVDSTIVTSSYDWILGRVAARDRRLAERIKEQLQWIWTNYIFRLEDEGLERARAWAQMAFRRLRLPRPVDEEHVVEIAAKLRTALTPVFAKTWHSLTARDREARPLIETIVGRSVNTLPRQQRLASFLKELLSNEMGSTPVGLSRARARVRDRRAKVILALIRCCRIVLTNPDTVLEDHGWARTDIEGRMRELEQELARLTSNGRGASPQSQSPR